MEWKMNREIKRQEMNRSIKRAKKNRNLGVFFTTLLLVFFSFLLFISQPETTPLWVRISIISLPFIIECYLLIVRKLVGKERRRRFLNDPDETFDIPNLKNKHKTILKDLKRKPKEKDDKS